MATFPSRLLTTLFIASLLVSLRCSNGVAAATCEHCGHEKPDSPPPSEAPKSPGHPAEAVVVEDTAPNTEEPAATTDEHPPHESPPHSHADEEATKNKHEHYLSLEGMSPEVHAFVMNVHKKLQMADHMQRHDHAVAEAKLEGTVKVIRLNVAEVHGYVNALLDSIPEKLIEDPEAGYQELLKKLHDDTKLVVTCKLETEHHLAQIAENTDLCVRTCDKHHNCHPRTIIDKIVEDHSEIPSEEVQALVKLHVVYMLGVVAATEADYLHYHVTEEEGKLRITKKLERGKLKIQKEFPLHIQTGLLDNFEKLHYLLAEKSLQFGVVNKQDFLDILNNIDSSFFHDEKMPKDVVRVIVKRRCDDPKNCPHFDDLARRIIVHEKKLKYPDGRKHESRKGKSSRKHHLHHEHDDHHSHDHHHHDAHAK